MFRQLVTPLSSAPPTVTECINSLFTYHPLQTSAIVETVWRNRYNQAPTQITFPFVPWSQEITYPILSSQFVSGYNWKNLNNPTPLTPPPLVQPFKQPGLGWGGIPPGPPPQPPTRPTNWDQLLYAYVIENTRIHEIFCKVLLKYINGGELETPSSTSQLFWRNLEFLIFGDAMPSMVWTTSGRLRRDEIANRLTTYYRMFGMDLSHAPQVALEHPYEKPSASNRDFIPTFEAFGREVWRGIENAKNTSGANPSDPRVIANLAERLYDMMQTQRQSGNLSREEFRAVAIMSYMHLAVLYDSPVVQDLRAEASSPEMRLQKIAERVGMTAHPKSKALFDLAAPVSFLMQMIETGLFNDAIGAQLLYQTPTFVSRCAETVIDNYSILSGNDLKALAVSAVKRATTAPLPAPKHQTPPAQLTAQRPNGRPTHTQ
jgi:hypothetical protein